MIADVVGKLREIGLGVGSDKSHWTSTPQREDDTLNVDNGQIVWEDSLTFVGTVLDLTGSAGPAMAYRMAQANNTFTEWRDVLCCPRIPQSHRIMLLPKQYGVSLLWSSSTWSTTKA